MTSNARRYVLALGAALVAGGCAVMHHAAVESLVLAQGGYERAWHDGLDLFWVRVSPRNVLHLQGAVVATIGATIIGFGISTALVVGRKEKKLEQNTQSERQPWPTGDRIREMLDLSEDERDERYRQWLRTEEGKRRFLSTLAGDRELSVTNAECASMTDEEREEWARQQAWRSCNMIWFGLTVLDVPTDTMRSDG